MLLHIYKIVFVSTIGTTAASESSSVQLGLALYCQTSLTCLLMFITLIDRSNL